MLAELHIARLGVIEDATMTFGPGLTVVTGETGAGKTMIVTGLDLVLGGKPNPALVRSGSEEAVVEAEVTLDPDHPAAIRARGAGIEPEEGSLILARTISAEGRSRAHVGGRRAAASVLTDLAEDLVAVHGQADQWRLTRPSQHRAVVDASSSEVAGAKVAYSEAHARWRSARERLASLRGDERDRMQRIDLLTHQLAQIDAVDPVPGEAETLAATEARLGHAEEIHEATGRAQRLLSDPDADGQDAVALIAQAAAALSSAAIHDPNLSDLEKRLAEVGVLASDVAGDLARVSDDVDIDPARLAQASRRRADLTDLTRRYGPDLVAVVAYRDAARTELEQLTGADASIEGLTGEVDNLADELADHTAALTQARRVAADRLTEAVTAELAGLGMGKAVVEIRVEQRAAEGTDPDAVTLPDGARVAVSAEGADEVTIAVAVNPGTAPRSVATAASGGELSRIMLALEVATAPGAAGDRDTGATRPTFVFDEVDAGVGGRAGLDVGARLAILARTAQVIVVTHLAQVAAHADHHLVVRKRDDGQVTSSDVAALDEGERVVELARMMGGGDTTAALQHAEELRRNCRKVAR